MVPIVDSVCEAMFESDNVELGDRDRTTPRERTKVQEVKRNLILLSCAYAANIGGTNNFLMQRLSALSVEAPESSQGPLPTLWC